MDKIDAEVPTDLLASLLMESASAPPTARKAEGLPVKVYGVMALTSLLTFGTLVTGYELLFARQLFA